MIQTRCDALVDAVRRECSSAKSPYANSTPRPCRWASWCWWAAPGRAPFRRAPPAPPPGDFPGNHWPRSRDCSTRASPPAADHLTCRRNLKFSQLVPRSCSGSQPSLDQIGDELLDDLTGLLCASKSSTFQRGVEREFVPFSGPGGNVGAVRPDSFRLETIAIRHQPGLPPARDLARFKSGRRDLLLALQRLAAAGTGTRAFGQPGPAN